MLIIVTGQPGTGKSTLCQKVVKQLNWKAGGFLTLPTFKEEERIGFDLFPLEDGEMITPGFPMARKNAKGNHTVFSEAFLNVGVKAIERGLNTINDCILMDEVGRFEKDLPVFLDTIWKALMQKDKPVLVVLKKEKLPFNEKVWGLEKGIHIDLDLLDREEAYQFVVDYIEKSR